MIKGFRVNAKMASSTAHMCRSIQDISHLSNKATTQSDFAVKKHSSARFPDTGKLFRPNTPPVVVSNLVLKPRFAPLGCLVGML